ncbi:FAD/NAD(P)-binding domain-containing protein [Artomyces pyxidatus]|uniref:FAD/NAD(P)-binding domain-containing protein n=1 Tax=Artomyces pyxidatus TaxID=48021 RepID=A0ACB8T6F5_9AGAM|nr:FAD/NAD(P)-binding domain-containing protein [Artomyces pyxidatus]
MADYISSPLIDETVSGEPKRICIIGAGANGLGTLKVLAETPQVQSGLWTPIAFEERENIGGIWFPAPPTGDPPLTPLYDGLFTNLPHPIMAYASFPFPPGIALFPSAAVVQQYLEDYAAHFDLLRYVRLNTRVAETRWDAAARVWRVTLSTGEHLDFDFVVAANGHYRVPRYPDVPGLQQWRDAGTAVHSAWYCRPGDFARARKVVVVGGGPIDISTEMRTVAPLVLHSVPGAEAYPGNFTYPEDTDGYRKTPRIAEYKGNGEVVFSDGTSEAGVDLVILATGYEAAFPFLRDLERGIPPLPPPLPARLHNSTYHVFPLAKHLFPLQAACPPTRIAFPGLPVRVAPFPLFEDQARALVRVLADPAALDVAAEAVGVVARAQALVREDGTDDPLRIAKAWFRFAQHEPFEYRAELNAFARPGETWSAPEWEVELWDRKVALRSEWKEAERSGEAAALVKGVGENGVQDWVDLCRKLIKRYDERNGEKTKL